MIYEILNYKTISKCENQFYSQNERLNDNFYASLELSRLFVSWNFWNQWNVMIVRCLRKMQFLLKSHQNPGSSKNQNHCRESITWPPRDSRDIIRDAKLHFDFFLFVCSNSMQFLIKHIPVSSSQPNPILNDRNTVLFTIEAIRYHWHKYSFDFCAYV